ncbi:serine/threonine-protein kinase [Dokdonella sp.]|nr:serine/threonine-protein kinase [Dokdonella sp.]MBX3692522.1 serine/threonine protein kinase [Dokdonella sp.]
MPIDPNQFQTGGALHGAVAASLVRECEAAAELQVGDEVGNFRVLRELGRGGMAVVYLAERSDGEYEQRIALKWMQAGQNDAAGEALFRRERQALADLAHPHIARLLDGGRGAQGQPWFAMEYIHGQPLDAHCIATGLPLRQRLERFLEVCSAVAFAHAHGVLHRDIKPSNVLVDGEGGAKLLDFGIAQLLGDNDALATRAFTPGYASPEQVAGEPLTAASDVYQLGRLLAAVLSRDADERDTVARVQATRVLAAAVEGTSEAGIPADLPADLAAILATACHLEPARRYATVEALASDVRAFLDHRPVAARPRTATYLVTRYTQRHPLGVALGALALAVLIVATLAFTHRLAQERDIAQAERDTAQRERDAAERARAASEAINRFLNEDLLDAANPLRRAPGAPDVTVRQALDTAEAQIGKRFAAAPDVHAEVLVTLGVVRYEFGEYERARKLYEAALQAAATLEPAHPARLRAQAEMGALDISEQDFARGIAAFQALAELGARELAQDDPRRWNWRLRLLEARSRQGADVGLHGEFEALAQEADAALGTPNAVSGEARLFIAQGQRMNGTPADGAAAAQRAHDDLSASLGVDHPSTLKALSVLAHGLQARGEYDGAIEAARRAFELQRARYGTDTIDTLFLQNEYGFLLSAVDRMDEAEPVFADLVERRAAMWGENAIQAVPPLSNLAHARMRLGRPSEALGDFQRTMRILDGLPDAPATIRSTVLRGLGDCLRELGRYREAMSALNAGDEVATALGPDDLRRFALQASRGRLLIAMGERERGLRLLDESIAAMQARTTDDNPTLKPLLAARRAMVDTP